MAERGRPTKFTQKLADEICGRIVSGESLRRICESDDMPSPSSVFKWLRENDVFSKQYARACEERSEAQIEELLELGDTALKEAKRADPKAAGAIVQAVRLKADNIKWNASKMKPKKYGEKQEVDLNVKELPKPLLGGNGLSTDDSDQESPRA